MQTTVAEMKMLSKRFYGNKFFELHHYQSLQNNYKDKEQVENIFNQICETYVQELKGIDNKVYKIFINYLSNQLTYCYENNLNFMKGTCLIELSIYIFMTAWEKRWNWDKTYDEFKQILVRHSLFSDRPPYSVYVYDLDDIKKITQHFLNTFFRYYSCYFFAFTPLIDLEVRTKEVQKVKDARDEELEALRKEGEQYDEQVDKELLQRLMAGNSIHNISSKKREELAKQKADQERQERIDRILRSKLEEIELQFEQRIRLQDEEFQASLEELKAPKKK